MLVLTRLIGVSLGTGARGRDFALSCICSPLVSLTECWSATMPLPLLASLIKNGLRGISHTLHLRSAADLVCLHIWVGALR